MSNLTAARAARLDAALDKVYMYAGETYTHRGRLDADEYAYVYEHTYRDGKTSRGLISHADAADALTREPSEDYPGADSPLQGLTWAAYTEAPKIVCDYAADTLPTVRMSADTFTVTTP